MPLSYVIDPQVIDVRLSAGSGRFFTLRFYLMYKVFFACLNWTATGRIGIVLVFSVVEMGDYSSLTDFDLCKNRIFLIQKFYS